MLEKDIEAKLVRGVRALGGECYKFVSPGTAGVPDRVAVFPGGAVVFVELKTDTGRLSPLQERQINKLRKIGASAVVLHGAKEVAEFLEYRRLLKMGLVSGKQRASSSGCPLPQGGAW